MSHHSFWMAQEAVGLQCTITCVAPVQAGAPQERVAAVTTVSKGSQPALATRLAQQASSSSRRSRVAEERGAGEAEEAAPCMPCSPPTHEWESSPLLPLTLAVGLRLLCSLPNSCSIHAPLPPLTAGCLHAAPLTPAWAHGLIVHSAPQPLRPP